MKRLIFVTLAFLVGCSGTGGGANRFLPVGSNAAPTEGALAARSTSAGPLVGADALHRGRKIPVKLTVTIPRHRRGTRAIEAHPSTISPSTMSVSIAINGGRAQNFNTTPTSSNCSVGTSGTVCTFSVSAPVGSDTFSVSTYNAVGGSGGTGAILDAGTAVIAIVAGKNNTASVRLGPVASSTSDSGPGSLRYAVANAATGDTIMVMLPPGSTITLASPITISTAVSVAGPGVSASLRKGGSRHPDTTYSGVTISGGGTVQIFVINAGATVTISGLILTQGEATTTSQPGGAVYNAGSANLASDVFVDNTSTVHSPYLRHTGKKVHAHHEPRTAHHKPILQIALRPHCVSSDQYGGAVYNHGGMTISGTTFDSNFVANTSCGDGYGGAVYNDEYGVLASSGNTYVNNAAYDGGAVYNNSYYGQATFTGDLFNGNQGCNATNGCATTGCTPSGSCSTYAEGYGAAIYDDEGPGITVENSTFENNVDGGNSAEAYGEGGALYLDAGSPAVNGSTFAGNVAGGGSTNCSGGEGGAIYLDSSYNLQLNNDTFTSNVAGGDEYGEGGAMYAYEGVSGSSDTFTSNKAVGNGSLCYSDGYGYGGAIYNDSGSDQFSLNSATFASNVATGAEEGYAGALYGDGNDQLITATFSQNAAIGTGITGEYTYGYGGAIYQDSDYLKVTNGSFTSNTVQCLGTYDYYCYGGAVYNDGSGMTSSNTTYSSNSATATGSYLYPYAYGGAIYSCETLSSSGDTFKSNSATAAYYEYGGALYNCDDLTMSNDTFVGNSIGAAQDAYGGALYNDDYAIINNTAFVSNSNAGLYAYGGAIYTDDDMILNGGSVSGNTAVNYGGGIYNDDSLYLTNTTVSGNTVSAAGAYSGGGGIYDGDYVEATNATISGNSVAENGLFSGGGGIYVDDDLSMFGSTISGNSVTGPAYAASGGGGMLIYDYAWLTNSTVSGNSSSSDGGGILNDYHGGSEFYNVTVYQNTATGTGGNVYNESTSSTPSSLSLGNSILAGGSAASGPDLANTGAATSGDYNIIQTAVFGTALVGTTAHDQTANPLLAALNNNGGPTLTNADQALSPGAADIPFSGGLCYGVAGTAVDQRGFTRGAGGRCDVGAFELSGTPSAIRVHAPHVRRDHAHPTRSHPHPPGEPKKPGPH